MAKEKSPAFQFYPKDLLADPIAMGLPGKQFKAYMIFLCYDWMDDGLPDDDKILCRLGGLVATTSLDAIRQKFIEHPTKQGCITNPRLIKERERQAHNSKVRSVAGGKGAESRWQTDGKPMAKGLTKNGLPSSTSTSLKDKNTLVSKADRDKWFNEIWSEYPRPLKKKDALKRFMVQIQTPADYERIKNALVNYKSDVENQRKNGHQDLAWQHGGTWFFKNWLDYVDLKPSAPGQPKPKPSGQDWKKQFEGDRPTQAEAKKHLADLKVKLK